MPGTPEIPGTTGELAALRAEIGRLRQTAQRLRDANERLRMLLADKDGLIGDLRARNAGLEERVARLERLISRNSGNSSMPPSTDDLPGKKPPERKARGGGKRKPGKQPGAPGTYLAWREDPDETVDVFPEGACGCGAGLGGAADLGVRYSHQVSDLPEMRAKTTQYDRHEVQCRCGRVHVADAPPQAAGAPGTVTYGLEFQAWCVFLMVMHHVPVERCADIIESMSGTRPSGGWVHCLLARAATAVAAANKTIRALIILARVICGDETPLRAGPGPKTRKKYLQVACTILRRHSPPAMHPAPAPRSGGRRPGLPGRDLARPDRPRAARPHPRRQPGPRPAPGRRPGGDDRRAPQAVPPRHPRRPVRNPPRPRRQGQAAARAAAAGMPARP